MHSILVFLLIAISAVAPRPAELTLETGLPVDGLERAEPSGLALYKGNLYTVSDNHDSFIYRIRVEKDRAVLEPAIPVTVPGGVRADFEGITCGDADDFYLISEQQFRILHVPADGKGCAWITPSLRAAGDAAGLFKFRGGYIEGLWRIDATHFQLCAERQPRGMIYLELGSGEPKFEGFVLDEPTVQPRGLRFPDFTDLCLFKGVMYALERNAEIISTIERDGKNIHVKPWRSFRETLEQKEYLYNDNLFGKAEGLAMDDAHVYIILDNNGDTRANDAADHRPLFFSFKQPTN